MKNVLLPLGLAAALPLSAFADVTIYGKASASFQSTDEAGDTTTEVVSNSSRIGVKGSESLSDDLKAIYKFEFEVHIDDGDKNGETFTQRNIYAGLQSKTKGTVIIGKFDTPLKVAQKKIDLFSDLEGDIKSILTKNENRESNSLMYSSPKAWGAVKASVAYIAKEDEAVDDGTSMSIAYSEGGIYAALAYDQNVEAEDAEVLRLVTQLNFGALQLGALYEDQDAGSSSLLDGDAWMLSAKYKLGKLALKVQLGESDTSQSGAETFSVGADYILSKQTKIYTYYTHEEADSMIDDNDYAGVGIELKF